jgi:glucose 1-dehydrogenase
MTAIVTGAASGIGRATAQLLLSRGDHVVGVDLDPNGIPDGAVAVIGDVSTEETNAAMVAAAVDRYGSLDTLVLNAGIAHTGSLADANAALIDRVLAVNLGSVALGIAAALPHLERGTDPAIVTVASISGMRGEPATGLYAASKGGVVNLTRQIAVDYGPRGVLCNAVAPGKILTGSPEQQNAETLAYSQARTPFHRLGRPEDVAGAALFLASDDSGYVSGTNLLVDGGWMAY